jgi:peptidoglycan hydrolase CwlO-like protein|tara:strand:- start:719 stop:901 length:183 start_codon:yes stop_codon:yes gene_type:complete
MDRKTMSYAERYSERIEQLENEIKEKQEELEYSTSQSTIDILEEEIYNTKQSIKELKKYD